jgi:hypothetical protein
MAVDSPIPVLPPVTRNVRPAAGALGDVTRPK